MATLSPEQIADYRSLAGDLDTNELGVTDLQIQGFYDTALTITSDTDVIEARVVVQILRRCLGKARKKIDKGGAETEFEKRSQLFRHIKDDLLPDWEGRAGMLGGGIIGVSTLTMDLYYDEDDFAAEAAGEEL